MQFNHNILREFVEKSCEPVKKFLQLYWLHDYNSNYKRLFLTKDPQKKPGYKEVLNTQQYFTYYQIIFWKRKQHSYS